MSKEITSKTKRLADILSLLENGAVKVPELADRFGVSIRTVQRDMGLLARAQVPVISPKQSVYSFAEGFSLQNAGLSAPQVALLVISADIAHQIGAGFEALQVQITHHFIPDSFEGCNFNPNPSQFGEYDIRAQEIFMCIERHLPLRVMLKSKGRVVTLYPYKLISLLDKWYVVTYQWGNIEKYPLNDMNPASSHTQLYHETTASPFRKIPFKEWAIWQCAHRWLADLQASVQMPQPIDASPKSADTRQENDL